MDAASPLGRAARSGGIHSEDQVVGCAGRESGIREVRRHKGFYDEPLKGSRRGQRSVRLNRAYPAIYVGHDAGKVELIEVLEVNKHDY